MLDREISKPNEQVIGSEVKCQIDIDRRKTLRNHHTATHIIFAACR